MTIGRPLRKVGLALAVSLLCAAAAELWLRRDYDPAATLRAVDEALEVFAALDGPAADPADSNGGRKASIPHPYYGYDTVGGVNVFERVVAEHTDAANDDIFKVVVLGGSVAQHFTGAKHGAVSLLSTRLREDERLVGRRLRVYGLARAGFKQPQQLLALMYLLSRGARPDVVVNLDGYNEIVLGSANPLLGVEVTWPSARHWQHLTADVARDAASIDALLAMRSLELSARRIAQRIRDFGLHHSALLGRWQLGSLRRERTAWARAQADYAERLALPRQGQPPADDRASGLDESVDNWVQSSLLLHEACAARGIVYVHALQPTLHVPGAKPITAVEREQGVGPGGLDPHVGDGYAQLREHSAQLREAGVVFADLTFLFEDVEKTLYYDRCHFRRPGNELVAERLAAVILANLKGTR